MDDLLKVALGALAGGVIGPIILKHYQDWDRERNWARPRKELLTKMLSGDLVFRTLDTLGRTIGAKPEDCRSLLIEIGARGATLPDGREAWALISRAPLQQDFDEDTVRRNRAVVETDELEE